MAGKLYGVGVGPGDPDLMTIKAVNLIKTAEVVAYHRAPDKPSTARSIAAHVVPFSAVEEELVYPVTTGHIPGGVGYYAAMADFYAECADRLRVHLEAGRQVVVLAEGDPLFYGSFMYVYELLSPHFASEVVPGVTSISAATAAAEVSLSKHEDALTVLPGTLPVPELARRLADTDAAIIMKLGRTFSNVREALRQAGLDDRAIYVERASRDGQVVRAVADVDPGTVPYMSLVVVPGHDKRADSAGRAESEGRPNRVTDTLVGDAHVPGKVYVVGLGPGRDDWVTPHAATVLQQITDVVGYGPYVARVPQRVGLERHSSGNTVEVDRARFALELAAAGRTVGVVSGGDPGVFAMAAAVFEAISEAQGEFDNVSVEVVPGITAAHAASSRVGAILGGDHVLISLSDRLKPWNLVVERLVAAAQLDMAIAIYNPRSKARPDQLSHAKRELLAVCEPERIVILARAVGRDDEHVTATTLGELDPTAVDMSTMVIVGSSATTITAGHAWTPRFTT